MNHNITRNTIVVCSLLFLVFFIFANYTHEKNYEMTIPKTQEIVKDLFEPKNTTILFVGDIMLDRGVLGNVNKYFGGDFDKLFINSKSFTEKPDITFGNLEGDVSDVGKNVGSIYSFRMKPIVLDTLEKSGFDIFSFANNHVGDWSKTAFDDTMKRLDEKGFLYVGAGKDYEDAQTVKIIEKNNVKFGFLGFSDVGPDWIATNENNPDSSGILIAKDKNRIDIIKNAKLNCDILIVSYHAGIEYEKHNERQEFLFKSSIDAGADLIVGSHPHVAQDIQIYKGKPILYSLGNFMFDQYFSKETMQGLVVVAEYKDKDLIGLKSYISHQNSHFQIEKIDTETEIPLK